MYCRYCGASEQDNNYCSACGKQLGSVKEAQHKSPFKAEKLISGRLHLDTSAATASLITFAIYVAWSILWAIGFANHARTMGYVDKGGYNASVGIGFLIAITGAILGISAWRKSAGGRGSVGYVHLLVGGILGTVLNTWLGFAMLISIN